MISTVSFFLVGAIALYLVFRMTKKNLDKPDCHECPSKEGCEGCSSKKL